MTTELHVLELLERFRFMTRSQLREAGIVLGDDYLGEVLRRLEKLGQIGHVDQGVTPGGGRQPYVHYLRKKGAAALAEACRRDLETLQWHDGKPGLAHDRAHRLVCVSVHLWLARVLGETLVSFRPYYKMIKGDGRLRHSSRLVVDGKAFVPDALFCVDRNGRRFGYALEIQRAKRRVSLLEQVANHAFAIREKVTATSLGVDAVAVIYVVEDERDLAALRMAAKTLAPLRGVLFGRTYASLAREEQFMTSGWEVLA